MPSITSISLEYVVEKPPLASVSISYTLPVASYHVGEPQEVPGVPVLGLRQKHSGGNTIYILERALDEIPMDPTDGWGVAQMVFRIHVSASAAVSPQLSAPFAVVREETPSTIDEIHHDAEWLFLLKQVRSAGVASNCLVFRLQSQAAGPVDPVDAFLDTHSIDCSNPQSYFEMLQCALLQRG